MVDFRAANLKIYNLHSSKRRSIRKDHTVALQLGLEAGDKHKINLFLVLLGFQFRTIVINNKRKDIVFRIFSS
jgi:hypothetical protein